jgi:hypothetical protein
MEDLIATPYGKLRAVGLEELQSGYDTREILAAVDALDRRCALWKRELRDDLLAVHGMAHTVVNGAPLTQAPGNESLPEVAYSLAEEFREWRQALQAAIGLLDQIAALAPD